MCLASIDKIEFTDKETGDPIEKYKYTFFCEDKSVFVGYLDDEQFEDKIVDVGEYDESKAHNFTLSGREYQGEITWKLMPES